MLSASVQGPPTLWQIEYNSNEIHTMSHHQRIRVVPGVITLHVKTVPSRPNPGQQQTQRSTQSVSGRPWSQSVPKLQQTRHMWSIKTPSFKLWVLNNITVPPRPKPGKSNAHKNLSLYRISGRPWTKSVSTKLTLQCQINTHNDSTKHRRQSSGYLYVMDLLYRVPVLSVTSD